MPSIDYDHLVIRFRDDQTGAPIVDGLDITVRDGEVVSLFGPNGCGKSTFLRFLIGQEPERLVSDSRPLVDKRLGYVPQDASASIMGWLSAMDNIALPLVLEGSDWVTARHLARERCGKLLDGIPLGRMGAKLSGGEQQLVLIARESSRNPDVLLIDEGFSSMDYERRFRVMEWLRSWCQDNQVAILAVGHNAEEIACFSDQALVLRPQPTSIAARISIAENGARGVESLGEDWLASSTQQIQRAFRAALDG